MEVSWRFDLECFRDLADDLVVEDGELGGVVRGHVTIIAEGPVE